MTHNGEVRAQRGSDGVGYGTRREVVALMHLSRPLYLYYYNDIPLLLHVPPIPVVQYYLNTFVLESY